MSGERQQTEGGQALTAIADAITRLLREFAGKGPTHCKAHKAGDDLLVVMLSGGFTVAEQTLFEGGHGDSVREARWALQDTLEARMTAVVEELTGRKVVAFMNASHQDPDLSVEIFVLGPGPAAV